MDLLATASIVVLIAAVMYGAYRVSLRSWDARLRGWAHDQGLHLLSFRVASFGEGPDACARSENQAALHVRVCDRTGRQRTAWLLFGDAWNPFVPADELMDVFWDD